jgi:site-specific DNA-adenine methylase
VPNFQVTCGDWLALVTDPKPWLLYLDPPYMAHRERKLRTYRHNWNVHHRLDHDILYNELYQVAYREKDRTKRKDFVLSYDPHPHIYHLYGDWCHIKLLEFPSNMGGRKETGKRKTTAKELVIWPKDPDAIS